MSNQFTLVCLYGYTSLERPSDDWSEYQQYLNQVLETGVARNLQLVLCGGQTLNKGSEAESVHRWWKANNPQLLSNVDGVWLQCKSKNTMENIVFGYGKVFHIQQLEPSFVICDNHQRFKIRVILWFLKLIGKIYYIPEIIAIERSLKDDWKGSVWFQSTISLIKSIIIDYKNIKA